MSQVMDRSFLLLLLISSTSFDLIHAQQQQFNSNPSSCNQPPIPPLNLFRDNDINDLAWRQPVGRFGFNWKTPYPWSQIPQGYPLPDPSTGMLDPSWRGSCDQSPWIQPPPPIIRPIRLPWSHYPWNLPACQQTPVRIDQQQDLDDDDDNDEDEEDANINFNTNTNSNVKDPRFLQAILKNLKGTVDEDGDPVFPNQ